MFMLWWDRAFVSLLSEVGVMKRMSKRYVDDINMAADEVPVGTRFTDGRLVVVEEEVIVDEEVPGDKRTMEVVRCIGNSIHPSIQLELDCPSNHADGKMPSLDLKINVRDVEGRKKIVHEFYAKEVSSKAVINANSAQSRQQKRTVLTQELLRVLLNCSKYVPWDEVAQHASNMVLRMQFSGYNQKFRREVVLSALKAYDDIYRKVDNGERPLYRTHDWNREERDREKRDKKLSWYKRGGYESVIFVQSTPRSKLKQRFQAEIDRQGLKIRVVEKAGRSLKSSLQRSNPFGEASCDRETCVICNTDGRGSCSKEGINYKFSCIGCESSSLRGIYHGESSKNGFTRGGEHLRELDRKDGGSIMWRHCKEKHGGVIQDFRMDVTGYYRNDAMLRQITEAVRINETPQDELVNNKKEWNFISFPRVMVDNSNED